MADRALVLASASPRRRELLTQIGVAHRVARVGLDESRRRGEAPADYELRLAREKAEAGWKLLADRQHEVVLAADAAVVLGDDILGKPRDRTEAVAMLLQLSGRTHQVLTAVAVRDTRGIASQLSESLVTFRPISRDEAEQYWATGEAQDKAGAYAIQGRAAVFIERIEGSYSGVMGLPLFETARLLGAAGLKPASQS